MALWLIHIPVNNPFTQVKASQDNHIGSITALMDKPDRDHLHHARLPQVLTSKPTPTSCNPSNQLISAMLPSHTPPRHTAPGGGAGASEPRLVSHKARHQQRALGSHGPEDPVGGGADAPTAEPPGEHRPAGDGQAGRRQRPPPCAPWKSWVLVAERSARRLTSRRRPRVDAPRRERLRAPRRGRGRAASRSRPSRT